VVDIDLVHGFLKVSKLRSPQRSPSFLPLLGISSRWIPNDERSSPRKRANGQKQKLSDRTLRKPCDLVVELNEYLKSWTAGGYMMPQFHRYDMAAEIIEAVK